MQHFSSSTDKLKRRDRQSRELVDDDDIGKKLATFFVGSLGIMLLLAVSWNTQERGHSKTLLGFINNDGRSSH